MLSMIFCDCYIIIHEVVVLSLFADKKERKSQAFYLVDISFVIKCIKPKMECSECKKVFPKDDILLFSFDDEWNKKLKEWVHPTLKKSSKMCRILEAIHEVGRKSEKVVVFSQFTSMLDLLEELLRSENVNYCKVEGSLTKKQRKDTLKIFKQPGVTVLLLSLGVGATGLNLTEANR